MTELIKELALEYCAIEAERLKLEKKQLGVKMKLREAIEGKAGMDSVERYEAYFNTDDSVVAVLFDYDGELSIASI